MKITELRCVMANNANQVAKYANVEGAVPDWIDEVIRDYRELHPRISAAVDELVGR